MGGLGLILSLFTGLCFVLYGFWVLTKAMRRSEPREVANRYKGFMFMALGGATVLAMSAFPPGRITIGVLSILVLAWLWCTWKYIRLLRPETIEEITARTMKGVDG